MKTKVNDAFVATFYRSVQSEEGNYLSFGGYEVIARSVPDQYGNVYYYVYDGGEEGCYNFKDEKVAEKLAAKVREAGVINVAKYWSYRGNDNINSLPDYVENFWRPEYN